MSITGTNNPFACEPVVFANTNAIVSLGTITRDGNEFTFSVGFVWKINGVTYQNTAPVVLTIAEASVGFNRIDNALLNTSNTIELQQGNESDTIALRPVAPDNNIILTSWNISGTTIGDTEASILGTQFKKKTEALGYGDPYLSGTNAVIQLRPEGNSSYSFSNPGLISIDGFGTSLISGNPNAEAPYDGKDLFIVNTGATPFTLKHDGAGTADVKFYFTDETNLVIPSGGKVWLKYGPSYSELIFKSWSEVDLSGKLDKVSTAGVERAYIINADGSQGTKTTSEFGVLETKNKLIIIPLGDLGVAIEDVTYEMVSDYINNLGIVVEKGENYYFEVIEVTYNFDLTSPNWAIEGVTDEISFINWLATRGSNNLTNVVVTDFNFVGDRIFCNMTADGTLYKLSSLGLVNADKIGVVIGLTTLDLRFNQIAEFNPTIALPSSLGRLDLGFNQIVTFNPTIPLPSSLGHLDLGFNQMTLASYTASEVWANSQPAFTNPCSVYFESNIDSISGTNLEAILITKNCVIY